MTRLLIVGGGGMFGHRLWLTARPHHETWFTLRGPLPAAPWAALVDPARVVECLNVTEIDQVRRVIDEIRPEVVVNAAGVVKQRPEADDPVTSIGVNALFPHQLAKICSDREVRLIHLSTDCVFSGAKGGYVEADIPDAADLYGRGKLLGEVSGPGLLTIRTSMIGRELTGALGLVEWLIGQRGRTIEGYRRAIFSGLTTHELARTTLAVIADHPKLDGVWHVAAPPIDKFALLSLLRDALGLDLKINPSDRVTLDRSLDDHRFRRQTGLPIPDWQTLIHELARDAPWYEEVR